MDYYQKWIMLTYKLPRAKTSAGKVALWRKLKKLGVYQIQDSICLLPFSDKNVESFQWIEAEIIENGGDASVWSLEAMSPDKEKAARDYFLGQVNTQYLALIKDLESVSGQSELQRKWAYYQKIKSQDHMKSPLSVEVKAAFERCLDQLTEESES